MDRLRTPDERFAALPDFPYAPRYLDVPAGDDSAPLRMAYVDREVFAYRQNPTSVTSRRREFGVLRHLGLARTRLQRRQRCLRRRERHVEGQA